MDKTTDSTKLTKLHELTSLLPREIRGQSHALPRIASAVRRGELGLTKPGRPRGSSLKGRKVPAKYRSRKDPKMTWAGRGATPRWMRDEMKAGKLKKEAFLIK